MLDASIVTDKINPANRPDTVIHNKMKTKTNIMLKEAEKFVSIKTW